MSKLWTVEAPSLDKSDAALPSPEQVELFLGRHPNFFHTRETLLAQMDFPHSSDGILSLATRQAEIMREKIRSSEKTLHELHAQAHANEERSHKIHRITTLLLRAKAPDNVLRDICAQITQEFNLAATLVNLDTDSLSSLLDAFPELKNFTSDHSGWKYLANITTPFIPRMNSELRELMLAHGLPETGSTAAIPLNIKRHNGAPCKVISGILLLIKREPHGFSPDMSGLFLEQIGVSLSAALERYFCSND